ncbi:Core domain protein [Escherichia coli D6-113.11]|nr:Core domain protein [Escherichia coli D6-113.11]CDU36108.1 Core domain protein [Escherichia coli D6-113.11]
MLALMDADGNIAWSGEYDEWGNQLNEESPHHLYQPYVCRASSTMRSRGWIITVTGTTIRCRGGISPRTPLG